MTGKSLQTIIRVGPVQRTSFCTCPI